MVLRLSGAGKYSRTRHLSIDAASDNLATLGGKQEGAAARLRLKAELQVLHVYLELHSHPAGARGPLHAHQVVVSRVEQFDWDGMAKDARRRLLYMTRIQRQTVALDDSMDHACVAHAFCQRWFIYKVDPQPSPHGRYADFAGSPQLLASQATAAAARRATRFRRR